MKHKTILLFLTMMLLATCAGCGSRSVPEEPRQEASLQEQSQQEESENRNPADGGELFTISNAEGSVTEFFEGGCKITPTHHDGDIAYEAAPGYESEEDSITVSYNDGCTFQTAYVNIQTGAATYETADAGDIKKQTSLIICGEYDDDNVLHADRIFIYRSVR